MAGLVVPGRSMILPGTIPETPISCECSHRQEQVSEIVLTGGFVNSAVNYLIDLKVAVDDHLFY